MLMTEAQAIVRVKQVTYCFSGRSMPVLDQVSLELAVGEILAIIGPSGCGKSTLLRLLAGLLQPTAGEIWIDDRSPQAAVKDYLIGLAFQRAHLFPWWTVLDNVLLPTRLRYRSINREQRQRAIGYLEQLGIGETGALYPQSLSGGMLQRAAIARALMGEAKLLLLDEPFSAVDEITQEGLWVDFRKVWQRQGLSVILVTHSVHEAVFMADRVLTMAGQGGSFLGRVAVPLGGDRSALLLGEGRYHEVVQTVRQEMRRC
jgi:NitT/TauT family transport system ATP-binding protein